VRGAHPSPSGAITYLAVIGRSPLGRRGGCGDEIKVAIATLKPQTGWSFTFHRQNLAIQNHHPVRSIN